MMNATYSPEDNKLRLYSTERLDPETYARVRAAGFIWAPKQGLFVAPMWTPEREDLLMDLCGEVGDEDTSLVERAEQRAERFEDYSERRAEDAERARAAVASIADGIPLGQPILVGHHSERRARRDAEKIQDGMRRAVRMWDTSQYWVSRAKGAIRAAKYKELPAVRHRRIKGLEADKRKQERTRGDYETAVKLWPGTTDTEKALFIAGRTNTAGYEIYSGLRNGTLTGEEAARRVIESAQRGIARCDRWVAHYSNRLEYERAMLDEQGGSNADKWDIQPGGRVLIGDEWMIVLRVNKAGGRINSVTTNARYVGVRGIEHVKDYRAPEGEDAEKVKKVTKQVPLCNFRSEGCIEMTTAEWKEKSKWGDAHAVRSFDANGRYHWKREEGAPLAYRHRSRYYLGSHRYEDGTKVVPVFLTDAPIKHPPKPDGVKEPAAIPAPERAATRADTPVRRHVSSLDELHEDLFYKYENGKLKAGIKYEYAGEGIAECYQYSTVADLVAGARALETQPRMVRYSIVTHSGEYKNMRTLYTWCAFDAIRAAADKGVQVVAAPQLYPTPPELAARMVEEAGIESGHRVLEPSVGTGNIAKAVFHAAPVHVVAVEINPRVLEGFTQSYRSWNNSRIETKCADFLQCNGDLGTFDRILMNPPFANGQDIAHIKHALHMLKPGGRLVAICANGPRQNEQLRPVVEQHGGIWEPLPAGTFRESGTEVNAVLLTIDK